MVIGQEKREKELQLVLPQRDDGVHAARERHALSHRSGSWKNVLIKLFHSEHNLSNAIEKNEMFVVVEKQPQWEGMLTGVVDRIGVALLQSEPASGKVTCAGKLGSSFQNACIYSSILVANLDQKENSKQAILRLFQGSPNSVVCRA